MHFALFILALSADPDGSGPSVGGPPSSKEFKGDNTGQGMPPSTTIIMTYILSVLNFMDSP